MKFLFGYIYNIQKALNLKIEKYLECPTCYTRFIPIGYSLKEIDTPGVEVEICPNCKYSINLDNPWGEKEIKSKRKNQKNRG